MAKIDIHEFDQQRAKLASGLNACAEQLRNTAQIVEDFAKMLEGIEAGSGYRDHEEDGSKKRKRASKPKDPNAPKRPASSYILFQNEIRTELKKQNPTMNNPQLLSLISDKWKNMSEEEKETYHNQMLRLKQEYSDAKTAYDNRSPEEVAAANRATEAAAALKKATKRTRTTKGAPPVAAATIVSPVAEASSSEDESEAESDDEPDVKPAGKARQESSESEEDSSDSDAEPEPAPKRQRAEEPQPKKLSKKSKA